jgi:RHS repeat-associated protein
LTLTIGAGSQIFYIHTDQLGTPRAITQASGNGKVWEWKNDDPFGANMPDENPSGIAGTFKYNLRFPGQYFDQETGTYYNYFRDYDPSVGRYVQSDPIGLAGGINTYGYVNANPLSLFDPFGLEIWWNGRNSWTDSPTGPGWERYRQPSSVPSQRKWRDALEQCTPSSRDRGSSDSLAKRDWNIPDADLSHVPIPRTRSSACMTRCLLKATGKFIGKEAVMNFVVEPGLATISHAFGKTVGVLSLGYGTYALTTDAMTCSRKCDAENNPPLPLGFRYAER